MNNNDKDNEYWKVLVLLLDQTRKEKGITQKEIAEATGLQRSNVARIFSLKYVPSLDLFLKIAKAVRINFFFKDKDNTVDLSVLFEKAMDELNRRIDELPKS